MTRNSNWRTLVAQGRELVRNIGKFKWDLGDLAAQIDDEDLPAFADEVHTSATILSRYKRVAAFWPPAYRDVDVAFSVYEELMRWSGLDPTAAQREYDRLVKVGVRLAVDDIRMAHGKTPTRPPSSARGRAEYAKRLLADDDVRKHAAEDDTFASAFAKDRDDVARRRAREATTNQRHRAPGLVVEHAVTDACTQMNAITYRIGQVIDTLKDETLTSAQRDRLTERAGAVVSAASLLADFLGNTDANFEEQVAALLAEGN